ncbi:MAG: hypothetical protein DI596_00575 [Azospira oryzae]|nr:MAG: hypothetical protein DI596_00575 [Azospira oryzae]PZP82950.1 MAG: hypothetical protein DI593_00575 [Azospira oryzae]
MITSSKGFFDSGVHAALRKAAGYVAGTLALIFLVLAAAGALFPEAIAQVAGSMPWEGPICAVIKSLRGPVVAALAVGAIAFAGIAMAWSESSMFDFLMKVIMGVGIAVLAVNIVNFLGGVTYVCG